MFQKDDLVVHPNHGAGIVTDIREIKIGETQRSCYCIDLVAESGTLMVSVEDALDTGLCLAVEPDDITSVLCAKPEELDDNYRTRQVNVTRKVHSGDAKLVAEVLRDLAWRKHTAKLSDGDTRLMGKAGKLLASILALHSGQTMEKASGRLGRILKKAILSQGTPANKKDKEAQLHCQA